MKKLLFLGAFCTFNVMFYGQVGINTSTPGTTLDVNGAITNRETAVAVTGNAATIPANVSQIQLTGAASSTIAVTAPAAPNAGQRLIVYNNTTGGFVAVLNSITIPNGQATEFAYSNGNWRATNAGIPVGGSSWNLLGNTGTLPATNFLGTADNQDLVVRTNNTEKMRVQAGGYIGIGTSAPGATTHIVNSGTGGPMVGSINPTNMGLRLENLGNGQGISQDFRAKNASGALKEAVIGVNPDVNTNGNFIIGRTGNTNDFRIDLSTGHLALGTVPSANTRLDVGDASGTVEFPILRISNTSPSAIGNKAILGFNAYNGGGATWGIGPEQFGAGPYESDFHIMHSIGGTYIKRFTVWANGNVGVGNSSPAYKLDVSGDIHTTTRVVSDGNVVLQGLLGIGTTSPVNPIHIVTASSIAGRIETSAATLGGGIIQMRKTAAAVNGDTWINFIANGSTVGYISSNSATTVAYNTTSDIRLKDNINNTHYGIRDLMKIDVKDYIYKADKDKTAQTGFIAQQLYNIFPVAVTKGGEDATKNPWAIDYGKVTPLLVKAIQDQQKQIDELKLENEKLASVIRKTTETEKEYAKLAQQLKELQQMMEVKQTKSGNKIASK
jgi:hypothetical protein